VYWQAINFAYQTLTQLAVSIAAALFCSPHCCSFQLDEPDDEYDSENDYDELKTSTGSAAGYSASAAPSGAAAPSGHVHTAACYADEEDEGATASLPIDLADTARCVAEPHHVHSPDCPHHPKNTYIASAAYTAQGTYDYSYFPGVYPRYSPLASKKGDRSTPKCDCVRFVIARTDCCSAQKIGRL
jgi:hypothetical protein